MHPFREARALYPVLLPDRGVDAAALDSEGAGLAGRGRQIINTPLLSEPRANPSRAVP